MGPDKPLKMKISYFYCLRFLPGLWILKIHEKNKTKQKQIKITPGRFGVMNSIFHHAPNA